MIGFDGDQNKWQSASTRINARLDHKKSLLRFWCTRLFHQLGNAPGDFRVRSHSEVIEGGERVGVLPFLGSFALTRSQTRVASAGAAPAYVQASAKGEGACYLACSQRPARLHNRWRYAF